MVNIDTVYQKVLAIANKEQRGYVTPQEFNLFADQAQMDIFEQYFYDINQFNRIPGNDTEYADMLTLLEEKIARFQVDEAIVLTDVQGLSLGNLTSLTEPVYRLGALYSTYENYLAVEAEEVTSNQFNKLRRSNLTSPSRDWPVYYKQGNQIKLLPNNPTASNQTYQLEYIRKPKNVVWAYGIGTQGQYIWDEVYTGGSAITPASGSQNFEIDVTDQTEVILKILMYAGVIIKDPEIIQAASGQAQMKDQLQSS